MGRKTKIICNPIAGNNALRKSWSKINSKLTETIDEFSVDFTEAAGDGTEISRRAICEGYEIIVAIGGDGTIHEVVNGFFENGKPLNTDAALGIIPIGTGSDWARTLQTPKRLENAAANIANKKARKCDVGLLRCQGMDGQQVERYFINIADAGFGGELAGRVNNSTKSLGSFFSYLIGLLRTLAIYENKPVKVRVDDTFASDQLVNSVIVANGQFFGGGMRIAPRAKIDDGLFDVVIIGDVSRRDVLLNLYKIYNGTLTEHPKATYLQGQKVRLDSDSEVLIEADGELPGKLPATFENLPAVLNVIC